MIGRSRLAGTDLACAAGGVLTAFASLYALAVASGPQMLVSADAAGARVADLPTSSLLARHGIVVLGSLTSPVVVALLPWWARRSRFRRRITIVSSVALTVFIVVASWSVGVAYIPGALALWMAVWAETAAAGRSSTHIAS